MNKNLMSDARSAPTRTPFKRILIANRGEIALRIMRTARRLGYDTVAVYSAADADSRHVREADQAVCIGEPPAARSYLRIDRILEAALASRADAVHPGYGFLSENPDFSNACREAGLIFIGPSPEAIRAMANKAGAKRIVQAAGIACLAGYQGEDQSDETMLTEAARIGFPVMIKATAGGGGRGMRLAPDRESFPELLRGARAEAKSAFGHGEMIIEPALVRPRHVEIQVFGDRYGNAIHLGERDCSIQRRHQKLIEETPSPAVSGQLRTRMGETAVRAVKAIGYEGAGTLEFLLDETGQFYFMEMNTRLQVEHPVTEAITGLDLVELQIRIARGEPLPIQQADVRFSGHAIEVRLCAENPHLNFVPQSGRILAWDMPSDLRVEHALERGSEISPFYDPMIAKVIAAGATREEARARLSRGLDHMTALGVNTNQSFLARCLNHPVFVAGGATTAFVTENANALFGTDKTQQAREACIGALLLYLTDENGAVREPQPLAPSLPIAMRIGVDGASIAVLLTRQKDGSFRIGLEEATHIARPRRIEAERLVYEYDQVTETVRFMREDRRVLVQRGACAFTVRELSFEPTHSGPLEGADGKIRASTNGRIAAVLVKVGERVVAGQPIVTLEAMKMENVHLAPIAGTIVSVVSEGDQVATNAIVAEIAAARASV
jgi:geranyl-CoA carboxylase alpha subunit